MFWFLACTATPIDGKPPAQDSAVLPAESAAELIPGDSGGSPDDEVFDPGRIHDLRFTMTDEAWADLRDNPYAKNWQTATVQIDDDSPVESVGVRTFGAGSLIPGKPSLKLAFDHVVAGQTWRGLEQLKLDNSSQDVGYLNERMATQILRESGVPAGRTGWARVEVNGAAVGFFVLLEAIDDRFLKRWFGDDQGPLYGMISGRWGQGLTPMEAPLDYYEVQTSVPGDGSELTEAAARLAAGEDVSGLIDLDGFFRESVMRSVIGGLDAFSADGNNFYLYVDEGLIRIIPWDFDYDLGTGGVSTCLGIDPNAPWIASPWSYNAVTGADYEDPVLKLNLAEGADVTGLIDEARTGALDWEALDSAVAASAALIEPEVQADALGYGAAFRQRVPDLRLFLHARLSQLAGEEVADCNDPGGIPVSAMSPTGTVGWGLLGIDQSAWGPGFNVAGEHYCRGLFAHAPSEVTITVPEGVNTLVGAVGLQDWAQACGDGASFSIEQGGVLWSSGVLANYDAAVAFNVSISPGSVLLRASPNAEYSCDTAAWLDVRGE